MTPELWVDIFEEGGFYLAHDPSIKDGKPVSEVFLLFFLFTFYFLYLIIKLFYFYFLYLLI